MIPGIAFLAAAAAVRIGREVGDQGIVDKALKLSEGCSIWSPYNAISAISVSRPTSAASVTGGAR